MNKINVEEILRKHITITNHAGLRAGTREIIEAVIDKCAEEAKVIKTTDDSLETITQIDVRVHKQSILNVKQQINYE